MVACLLASLLPLLVTGRVHRQCHCQQPEPRRRPSTTHLPQLAGMRPEQPAASCRHRSLSALRPARHVCSCWPVFVSSPPLPLPTDWRAWCALAAGRPALASSARLGHPAARCWLRHLPAAGPPQRDLSTRPTTAPSCPHCQRYQRHPADRPAGFGRRSPARCPRRSAARRPRRRAVARRGAHRDLEPDLRGPSATSMVAGC